MTFLSIQSVMEKIQFSLMLNQSQDQCSSLKAHCFKKPPNSSIREKACSVSGIRYPLRHLALGGHKPQVLHSVGEGDEFAQDGENGKGDANI